MEEMLDTTREKGDFAVAKVKLRAIEKGFTVSTPDSSVKYDLIIDERGSLKKVQVKYADGRDKRSNGTVTAKLCTYYRSRNSSKVCKYSSNEIDYVLVYIPKIDQIVKLETDLFQGRESILLRLQPSRNSAIKGNEVSRLLW